MVIENYASLRIQENLALNADVALIQWKDTSWKMQFSRQLMFIVKVQKTVDEYKNLKAFVINRTPTFITVNM